MKLKSYLRGIGIGIIVTAAILHFSNTNSKAVMTDDEIKARARELGMIESTTLSEFNANVSDNDIINDVSLISASPSSSELPTQDAGALTSVSPSPSETPSPSVSPSPSENPSPSASPSPSELPLPSVSPSPSETPSPSASPSPSELPSPSVSPSTSETSSPSVSPSPSVTPSVNPTTQTGETIIISVNSGEGSDSVARKLANNGLVESATDYDRYLCSNGYANRIRVGNHEIPVGATYEEIAKIITSR